MTEDGEVVHDGVGDPMTDSQIRDMLRRHVLAAWSKPYREVDTTVHRDGGATVSIRLSQDDIQGIAQTW